MNYPGSGFLKMFFPKENVQTKYKQIYEIPIMTIDKQIAYISQPSEPNQNILFVHLQKIKQNQQLLQNILKLKTRNYSVYVIPEQTPFQQYTTIKQNIPKGLTVLGKMVLNGQRMHPLIKYLKCYNQRLYDFKWLGANTINDDTGIFIKNNNNNVKYIRKRQIYQISSPLSNKVKQSNDTTV